MWGAGIEPYVTLYHWDLPQALEDRYNGWLHPQIMSINYILRSNIFHSFLWPKIFKSSIFFCTFFRKDFAVYVETCFEKFGDRVKHWITFNEPHTFTIQGYDVGLQAPGRCSILLHIFCRGGNSATEPYIVAHNVLLSHATVADIYRRKYKV